ncbi:MAG: hypothetical protein U0163_13625 [Gemmatimonadaceae bacterium]
MGSVRFPIIISGVLLVALTSPQARGQTHQRPTRRAREKAHQPLRAPIVYDVRVPVPSSHVVRVDASFPTDGRDSVDLMMAIWSPGYYRVEHYESRVSDLAAHAPGGAALRVAQPAPNRWRVYTDGQARVLVSYSVRCVERSVTLNWVDDTLAVLNGAPTFITLADRTPRPHQVQLQLAPQWPQALTGLAPSRDGLPNHYVARDYDELVDSPIVAGTFQVREFTVGDTKHVLATAGAPPSWDDDRATHDLERIVAAQRRFWGTLPYSRYVFLNLFRPGGGGLEHSTSTLLTSSAARMSSPSAYLGWLMFVSHEYFHAMNVKRLRPVELGPFDYEKQPSTQSLWISEGLTSYFGELTVERSGVGKPDDVLNALSSHIAHVQNAPGRLVQTLAQSSLDVWSGGISGIGRDSTTTVSYYEKGAVVGFLLDAHLRRLTKDGACSTTMRSAYHRYPGARGFTPDEFRQVAEQVCRRCRLLGALPQHVVIDRRTRLRGGAIVFGPRFRTTDDSPEGARQLETRRDFTPAQRAHLDAWLSSATR